MSDTGSVNQNLTVTEFLDPQACERTAREITGTTQVNKEGHNFTVIARAICAADGPTPPPARGSIAPPPIRQFFNEFNNFIQRN